MGTTYPVTYPCIQDGLVFYADAKNRKSWDGGTTMCDPFQQQYSGSGTNVTGDDWDGALTTEGYWSLDGTDDKMHFGTLKDNPIATANPASLCIWLKSTDVKFVTFQAPGTANDYTMAINTANGARYADATTGVGTRYKDGVADANFDGDGDWHYYVVAGVNLNHTEWSSKGIYVSGYGSFYYAGDIGPITMYNRTLSASEVLTNYNMVKGRFGL